MHLTLQLNMVAVLADAFGIESFCMDANLAVIFP